MIIKHKKLDGVFFVLLLFFFFTWAVNLNSMNINASKNIT